MSSSLETPSPHFSIPRKEMHARTDPHPVITNAVSAFQKLPAWYPNPAQDSGLGTQDSYRARSHPVPRTVTRRRANQVTTP
ncbi:hypothetical protein E4U54_001740, partial [Claviceps lovelessii]